MPIDDNINCRLLKIRYRMKYMADSFKEQHKLKGSFRANTMSARETEEDDNLFTPPPAKKAKRRSDLHSLQSNFRYEKYAEPS